MSETPPEPAVAHQVLDVGGLEVLHFPSSDTVTSASLIFGVGERHETLSTLGSLHALEHLVMDAARDTAADINASVDAEVTQFEATGRPERVGTFLNKVCDALQDPPTRRLAREARVLAVEMIGHQRPDNPLLVARYGWRDLGVSGGPGPGPEGLRAEHIKELASTWFITGNAVLVVDGPLPPNLDLPLRRADRPTYELPRGRRFDRPHAITEEEAACAVSLILPAGDRMLTRLLSALAVDHLTEALRHEGGVAYTVEESLYWVADGRTDLIVAADAPPERALTSARTMTRSLLDLLNQGPSTAQIDRARERVIERGAGRSGFISERVVASLDRLVSSRPAESDPSPSDLSDARVRATLRLLADDVLFLVDESVREADGGGGLPVAWFEPGRPGPAAPGLIYQPSLFTKVINREARSARVTVHEDGLSRTVDGLTDRISWSDVAGVMRIGSDEAVVFALDGTSVPIGSALYRKGNEIIDAVLAAVDPSLVYAESRLLDEASQGEP